MLHSRLCSGHKFCNIFSKLKLSYFLTAWRYFNSVNGISLPIIHTIDMDHRKQGKSIFLQEFCSGNKNLFPLIVRAALRNDLVAVSPTRSPKSVKKRYQGAMCICNNYNIDMCSLKYRQPHSHAHYCQSTSALAIRFFPALIARAALAIV